MSDKPQLNRVLDFRASEIETERIDEAATLAGFSNRSDYLRSLVLRAIWAPQLHLTVAALDRGAWALDKVSHAASEAAKRHDS